MKYEDLQEEARKKPHSIWIDEGSVREIALAFQSMAREPASIEWIERGIRSGTMSVYGVPVRVHELVH